MILGWKGTRLNIIITVQCKYFEDYKFHGFHCFSAKRENYSRINERTPIVTWLNYACNPWNLFSMKSKFWQIQKIYSPRNICAIWYYYYIHTGILYCWHQLRQAVLSCSTDHWILISKVIIIIFIIINLQHTQQYLTDQLQAVLQEQVHITGQVSIIHNNDNCQTVKGQSNQSISLSLYHWPVYYYLTSLPLLLFHCVFH